MDPQKTRAPLNKKIKNIKMKKVFQLDKIKYLYFSKIRKYGHGGQNGEITVRHKKKGAGKLLRVINENYSIVDQMGLLLRIEFDPYRGAFLGLIYFKKIGLFSYTLLTNKLKVGSFIKTYSKRVKKFVFKNLLGSSFKLAHIPLSTPIHNIQWREGGKSQLAKAAGTFAKMVRVFKKKGGDEGFGGVRLPSGKMVIIPLKHFATIGQISNISLKQNKIYLAGRSSKLGTKPKIRGVAMNPVDHPHGGGEGKTSGGRISVSRWGWLAKGGKTLPLRKKKRELRIFKRVNRLK
jgi:large subunit ribosomal protein L2